MGREPFIKALDDMMLMWGKGSSALDDDHVVRRRRKYRLSMVLAIGASYAIDTLFLALFSIGGILPPAIPVAHLLCALGHVGIFGFLHWSGISDRSRNPHLPVWQMAYAITVQLGFMWLAPVISTYFMAVLIIVFAFAVMRVSLGKLLTVWVATCIATGFVLMQVRDGMVTIDHPSPFVTVLIMVSFATVLLRCILVGYYGAFLRRKLFEYSQGLVGEIENAEDLAIHDELTGALNRHILQSMLEDQINLTKRNGARSSVVMIDIDYFKRVNDRYGHPVGDRVLREVARIIGENTRATDKVCRYGGEEFLALLVDSPIETANETVERIRTRIADADWHGVIGNLRLSVSAGITEIRDTDTVPSLILRVDSALYEAKDRGRNLVIAI
jgi:diguanylate cyclase (GGDEF)-like protein